MLASNILNRFQDRKRNCRLIYARSLFTNCPAKYSDPTETIKKQNPPSGSFTKNPLHLSSNHTRLSYNAWRPGRRRRRIRNLAQPRQSAGGIPQRPVLALRRRRRPNQRAILGETLVRELVCVLDVAGAVVDFVAAPLAVGRHGAPRGVDAAAEQRAEGCERGRGDAEAGFDDGP